MFVFLAGQRLIVYPNYQYISIPCMEERQPYTEIWVVVVSPERIIGYVFELMLMYETDNMATFRSHLELMAYTEIEIIMVRSN